MSEIKAIENQDLRNKLTPMKNLLKMLDSYFNGSEFTKGYLEKTIKQEMITAEQCLNYILSADIVTENKK